MNRFHHPNSTRREVLFQGMGLMSMACSSSVLAADAAWPVKPLKMIVPYIPGSAPDVLSRVLAERLATAIGQSVVIENKPGAGGNIGMDALAKSAGDGYTIGLGTNNLAINPVLYRKVSYDSVKDFTHVHVAFAMPHALIVHPQSKVQSIDELIAMLRAAPGKHNYASGGNGSGAHLCAELFKSMAKVDAVHVPYRGAPEIINAVLGQSVLFGFPTLSTAVPLAKSGKVKVLAVSGPRENAALPGIPPVGKAVPGFELMSWFALIAPAGLPAPVTARLDAEVAKMLSDPGFRARVQADGTEIVGIDHKRFPNFLQGELVKWKRAVELSGAKVG